MWIAKARHAEQIYSTVDGIRTNTSLWHTKSTQLGGNGLSTVAVIPINSIKSDSIAAEGKEPSQQLRPKYPPFSSYKRYNRYPPRATRLLALASWLYQEYKQAG